MNESEVRKAVALAMGLVLVGAWLGYFIASRTIRTNAIQNVCAYYDTKTGEFKWGQP